MKRDNKKGSATPIIVIILLIVLIVAFLVLRMHWREFKARAGFTTTIILIALVIVLILFLYIRHRIRKAKKEKLRARLEAERIANGEPPTTLGDGKFEFSDITETAGKAADKVSGMFGSKDDQDQQQ